LRIGQIVTRVGYHDESSFRRQFKQTTNVSPTDYRKHFGLSADLVPTLTDSRARQSGKRTQR
jgi:AraC-like DNA-binding protein